MIGQTGHVVLGVAWLAGCCRVRSAGATEWAAVLDFARHLVRLVGDGVSYLTAFALAFLLLLPFLLVAVLKALA